MSFISSKLVLSRKYGDTKKELQKYKMCQNTNTVL